jgi:pyridinium-3,5-bisthiocarboxylic acid mononucleotide nickel chelatase
MKVAHFDCFSGISGDMTLAALIDAGVDGDAIRQAISSLGLPIRLEIEKVRKGGFAATQVRMEVQEEKSYRFLPEVEAIIGRSNLTERQKSLALKIFQRLAEAEAAVHGLSLEKIHFHEVGALDSIADIVGAAVGLELLGAEQFTSRSVPTGSGMVKCAHGLMPVPAPGTAELLKNVPLAPSSIKTELTTPTGAAILTTIVRECPKPADNPWVDQPLMTVERIGHGAGRRDFPEQPNLLRLFVGTTIESLHNDVTATGDRDLVWLLETNLDDLPAEVIGYCYERLLAAGALDVFSTPIFMKKNRPAVMLSVLAPLESLPALEEILFRETSTFGIRRYQVSRTKLERRPCTVQTPWGAIQGKLGWRDGQPALFAPEYEDCARVARQFGVALREVYAQAQKAFSSNEASGRG